MNGTQSKKTLNVDGAFPGCLGRMVNLFDLSSGVAGNRMLMDRPHTDGSTLARSQSDVVRMSSHFGDKIEDKRIVSESRRASPNSKSNITPMKMLLDEEMSKEIVSRNEPPNVIAKLMGLDELPRLQNHSTLQRSNTNSYSRTPLSNTGKPLGSWEQEDLHLCRERNDYKDVYEVWQQPQKTNHARDMSPQKNPNHEGSPNDAKMALVREKFLEAKRLATDEKLRQSKEFQDALEVLSLNRDLFVKFLQEPNSLFSEHLYELQSLPLPNETKRITVLRPSKIVEGEKFSGSMQKSDKKLNKTARERCPVFSNRTADEYPSQPTRIVVLKPSAGKAHDIRAVVSSPCSSPRVTRREDIYDDHEDLQAQESREVAKQITRHMRENLMGHRRDETLISSVFSNGYTGDESSFNKSEIEFAVENLSDSEVLSPSSRHSWDYINRLGSPFSSSSFSRASCSPESAVCREAKKRLSERWAMVASNGSSQEPKHFRRSSSTLGEMLALSDAKKTGSDDEIKEVSESRELGLCLNSDSPRSLSRSKSVPVLSTVYDSTVGSNEAPKGKSAKSSLKGKVSSLFFSRGKKSSKEKSESEMTASRVPHDKISAPSQRSNEMEREECLPPFGSSTDTNLKPGVVSREAGPSLSKVMLLRNTSDNQDQPSPISVLEPSFEEYENMTGELSSRLNLNPRGGQLTRSNLIDKSPPIESIARTLWDDSCIVKATPFPSKPYSVPILPEDEEYWLGFVKTLLSAVGSPCDPRTPDRPRWQSAEAPLDPSLRDKYANTDDKEPLHEAKRRQIRSMRKLVFDSVNATLADVTALGDHEVLVERVWGPMREWLSGEVRCSGEDGGEADSLAVDGVVRREVVGRGWAELMGLERGNLGREIERKLLQELVEEVVKDF